MNVFVPNDEMPRATKIIERYLGVGNKCADCTPDQADALQLIYDELIMYAEENNLK